MSIAASSLPAKYQNQVSAQLYAKTDRQLSGPVAQPPVRHVPDEPAHREKAHSGRFLVRVTSVRKRLIDPDNLCPKYFVDCCRYAGLILGDAASEVEIVTTQRRVSAEEEEHTEIVIEPIVP